jgi:hypothetical protein
MLAPRGQGLNLSDFGFTSHLTCGNLQVSKAPSNSQAVLSTCTLPKLVTQCWALGLLILSKIILLTWAEISKMQLGPAAGMCWLTGLYLLTCRGFYDAVVWFL